MHNEGVSYEFVKALGFTRGRIAFVDSHNNPCAPTQGQVFFYFASNVGIFNRVFFSVRCLPERPYKKDFLKVQYDCFQTMASEILSK